MTNVSNEAGDFLKNALLSPNVPSTIKSAIAAVLSTGTARENALRLAISTVKDGTQLIAVRVAAMRDVIRYYRGDL